MKQLTIGDILTLVSDLKITTDMTDNEINELPVYIGNDEELNGIHQAFYVGDINDSYDDCGDIIDLIESDCCNGIFIGKAILIS